MGHKKSIWIKNYNRWFRWLILDTFRYLKRLQRFMYVAQVSRSHMSGALDGTEKNSNQKLDHPMLVQPILSQKNQKSKFFNEPFFCN